MKLFKEKKITRITDLITDNSTAWMKNIQVKFNAADRLKVKRNKPNSTLLPIASFLDRYENILLNNKQKPGFSTKSAIALVDKGKNPIYKKLSVIDSIELKERLLQKNEMYSRFSFIFNEKSPDKTIYIIRELKEYYKKLREHTGVTSGPSFGLVWNLMFWVFLVLFNTIIVYWGLLDNNTVTYEVFSKHWWDFIPFATQLLYGTNYIDNDFIKYLAYVKVTFAISFLVFFFYTLFRSIGETTTVYRLRLIDKLINELGFLKVLKVKIKGLEVEAAFENKDGKKEVTYLYQNFIDLLRETALVAQRKGFTNQSFTNDFMKVLTLYSNFRKFPPNSTLTEGFQNLLIMVLDWYYSMLNWTNSDFDFGRVLKWVENYEEEIQAFQWEKKHYEAKSHLATLSNMVTTWTILVVLLMSMSQGWLLEKLIKLSG